MEKTEKTAKNVENKPSTKSENKNNKHTQEKKVLTPEEERVEMEKRGKAFFGPSLDFSHILPNLIISDGKGGKKKAKFANLDNKNKEKKPAVKKEKKEFDKKPFPNKPNQNKRENPKPTHFEKKSNSTQNAKSVEKSTPNNSSKSYQKPKKIVLQKKVKPKKENKPTE